VILVESGENPNPLSTPKIPIQNFPKIVAVSFSQFQSIGHLPSFLSPSIHILDNLQNGICLTGFSLQCIISQLTSLCVMLMTQVFRWSALGAGVLYGVVHRNTLAKQAEYKQKQADYAYKEELIKEAKAEYQKKKNGHNESSTILLSFVMRIG
jgi:hypothetical protein